MSELTSKERIDFFFQKKSVDRLPNFSLIGNMVTKYTDKFNTIPSMIQCLSSTEQYRELLDVTIAAAKDLGVDYFQNYVQFGSNILCEANGFDPMQHKTATGAPGRMISDPDEIASLKQPDLSKSKLMKLFLTQAEISEHYLSDMYTMTTLVGPATICGGLCGVENFLMFTYDDPEAVEAMMDLAVETSISIIEHLARFSPKFLYIADPTASLLSPSYYGDIIAPRQKKIIDAIHEKGSYCRLHMCGDTNRILPYSSTTGTDLLDVDHAVDYVKAVETFGTNTVINGNIDPCADVLSATPEHVHQKILALYQATKGKRCLYMPGCELPADTPKENVRQIKKTLQEIAN